MSDNGAVDPAARARMQAEHRAIVQATMQAKRSGKLPQRNAGGGSEAVTAIVVIAAVLVTMFLALRYGG